MRKQEQEARSFFSHGHTEVCNNDIEFVPACREPAVIKGESLGGGTTKISLLETEESAVVE